MKANLPAADQRRAEFEALYARHSREVWAIYNGFIVYLVIGTLLGGEWLLRRHLFPHAR